MMACPDGRKGASMTGFVSVREFPGSGRGWRRGSHIRTEGPRTVRRTRMGTTVRGRAERAPWAPSPYLMIWGVPSGGQVGSEDPTRTRSGCMSSFPQWKRMAMRKLSKLRKPLAADLSAWMTEL